MPRDISGLRPCTKENAAARGHLGGIKSGESKRAKKALKESLEIMLGLKMKKDGKCKEPGQVKSLQEFSKCNMTAQNAWLFQMLTSAIKGDKNSSRLLISILNPGAQVEQVDETAEQSDQAADFVVAQKQQVIEYQEVVPNGTDEPTDKQ